ncbi:hypothetical protein [Caballeronia sp. LZ035]|uniref:hypothetical protein n=1 Tax=Caballeronia sp. LZ035 TaxID=3038568 RepID=UPI002857F227|nr:hypothetical protein [Caballeronia sp. LZ035]MDR5762383.1 hypothetical protein [Caballeronia sp. LZ035]
MEAVLCGTSKWNGQDFDPMDCRQPGEQPETRRRQGYPVNSGFEKRLEYLFERTSGTRCQNEV